MSQLLPTDRQPVRPVRIVLTGGGSGGHITPLLPIARALKTKSPTTEIIYIGLKGEKIDLKSPDWQAFDRRLNVSSGKFRRYHGESFLSHLLDIRTLWLNFVDFFKVLAGTWQALSILGRYKPDVVFSKGGFVVVPVGLAAKLRGTPIVTHDSDAVPGLANRIVGRWAKVHATGMPAHYYKYEKSKTVYTGIPLDGRLEQVSAKKQYQLKKDLGIDSDGLLMLASGGGHGSRTINNLLVEVVPQLMSEIPDLWLVHITGEALEPEVAGKYVEKLSPQQRKQVKVYGFSNKFAEFTAASDLVVARAGATTIAELALMHKPAVIIPSPFLAAGHQLKNAEELTTKSAAVVLQNNIEPQKLFTTLKELLLNQRRREALGHNIGALAHPRAAADLAAILLAVAEQKNAPKAE